jgi:bacteriorhodopsin
LIYFVGWLLFPVVWIFSSDGLNWLGPANELIIDVILGEITKDAAQFIYFRLKFILRLHEPNPPAQNEKSLSQSKSHFTKSRGERTEHPTK